MEASVQTFVFPESQRRASMLRLDTIHSWASGNKYFKLKYALQEAMGQGYSTVVSKGGMFSNHLAALADACKHFNLHLIALIRSYGPDKDNPSIQYLADAGVTIQYLTPEDYRNFDEVAAENRYAEAFFIPEGGLSLAGIRGTSEILHTMRTSGTTHILVAGGTLGTALGLMRSADQGTTIIIVPAWKGCTRPYVEDLMAKFDMTVRCSWEVWSDFHFGGFGRFNASLTNYMTSFSSATGIPLDPVYTGKAVFAADQKMQENYFGPTDELMIIHTGGLQGLKGYQYRFPEQWSAYAQRYGGDLY